MTVIGQNGGLAGKRRNVNAVAASGVWSLHEQIKERRDNLRPSPIPPRQVWAYYRNVDGLVDVYYLNTDLTLGGQLPLLPYPDGAGQYWNTDAIRMTPDANFIAFACVNDIKIYKKLLNSYVGLTVNDASIPGFLTVTAVAISSDGAYAATAGYQRNYVSIYKNTGDVFSLLTTLSIAGNEGSTPQVNWSADTNYLAFGSGYGSTFVWKRTNDTFSTPQVIAPVTTYNSSIIFSPNSQHLAISFNTGQIQILSKVGDTFASQQVLSSGVNGEVKWSPGSNRFAITGTPRNQSGGLGAILKVYDWNGLSATELTAQFGPVGLEGSCFMPLNPNRIITSREVYDIVGTEVFQYGTTAVPNYNLQISRMQVGLSYT